mmetsp:Transcript_5831/g.36177  ORF Transcript_5831/g.36177 Transcript_5831/m.36177 type:complete len:202 (+) Transcript_5831:1522-2127(+)
MRRLDTSLASGMSPIPMLTATKDCPAMAKESTKKEAKFQNCIATWCAATGAAPKCVATEVANSLVPKSATVRIITAPPAPANSFHSSHPFLACGSRVPSSSGWFPSTSLHSFESPGSPNTSFLLQRRSEKVMAAHHSAMAVASPAPSTPLPKVKMSHGSRTALSPLDAKATASGVFVSCMPLNAPCAAQLNSAAGAPIARA